MSRQSPNFEYEASPFEDDYRGFDPREDGSRGPLILALAIGVLLIFGAVVWNTYRQGVRADSGLPAVILGDSVPYKHAPGDTLAERAPPLEKTIYNQFEETTSVASAEAAELLKGGPPVDLRGGLSSGQAVTEVASLPPVRRAEPKIEPVRPAQPVQSAKPEPTLIASPSATRSSPWNITPSGAYLVQVGAFRSEDAANTAWNRLRDQVPNLVLGAERSIQRADLGSRGIFYRLRASAFPTRSDAVRFCDALKDEQLACIVVSR